MIERALAVCVAALLLGGAQARAAADEQPHPADLSGTIQSLQEEAAAWIKGADTKAPRASAAVAALQPTRETLLALRQELARAQSRNAMEDAYIRCQLLAPLQTAAPEDIRPLLPIVTRLEGGARYQLDLPEYSQQDLASLSTPVDASGSVDFRALERIQTLREQKVERERQILRQNALIRGIVAAGIRLRLRANQPEFDRQVIQALKTQADQSLATYVDVLDAISAAASGMDARRAKSFYDDLLAMARAVGNRQDRFTVPNEGNLANEQNSRLLTEQRVIGADLARTANALAMIAGQPQLPIPQAPARNSNSGRNNNNNRDNNNNNNRNR